MSEGGRVRALNTDALADELKRHIVADLELEDVEPEQIGLDDPLFVEGLGLDSIDALELVVMLEKRYQIRLTEMETARAAFTSVRTLAEFIQTQSGS
jgi:acyl carrier protein